MKIEEGIIRKVIYMIDESGDAVKDEEFIRSIEHVILEMKRLQKKKNANKRRNS